MDTITRATKLNIYAVRNWDLRNYIRNAVELGEVLTDLQNFSNE